MDDEDFELGATGKFPEGELDPTDEGEFTFAITCAGDPVKVEFTCTVVFRVGLNTFSR